MWGFAAAAALLLAPPARAGDDADRTKASMEQKADEAKAEAKETSDEVRSEAKETGGEMRSETQQRGEDARASMNQADQNAKQTPPDHSRAGTTAAAGTTEGGTRDESKPSRHDNTDLIQKLHAANVMEIEAAKLAKDNAQGDAVKDFAERMEKDHGDMNDQLEKLADDRGLKLDDDAAKEQHKAHLDAMKEMKGATFDSHYRQMMVQDHKKSLAEVDAALKRAKSSGDQELTRVLQSARTKIQEHDRLAKNLGKATTQRSGRRGSSERGATGAGTAPQDAATGTQGDTATGTQGDTASGK
jgi:putative membrane protein